MISLCLKVATGECWNETGVPQTGLPAGVHHEPVTKLPVIDRMCFLAESLPLNWFAQRKLMIDSVEPVPRWRNGRRRGLKILRPKGHAGSSPALGTNKAFVISELSFVTCASVADRNRPL